MASAIRWLVHSFTTTILRSPLHGLYSNNTLLLTFQGKKSGKTYQFPVSYVCEGDVVQCFSYLPSRWWKNLQGGAPVTVNIQGQQRQGSAEVVTDDRPTIERELKAFIWQIPRDAHSRQIRLDVDGTPNHADILRVTHQAVLIRIQLV